MPFRYQYLWVLFALTPVLAQGQALRVGVSVLPLQTLVSEIGGDAVEVRSLQQEGDSCSIFEPRPSVIAWLSGADLFFRVGAGYESVIMEKLEQQFPGLAVSDLRDSIESLPAAPHHHADHAHHHCPTCAADSGATDPHIWLDPVRLQAMALQVARELGRQLPDHANSFSEAAEGVVGRLQAIHEQLQQELAPLEGTRFYIYHPALAYFAQRYDLQQVAIAGPEGGASMRQLHRLVAQAKEDDVRWILVQPQESQKQARALAVAVGAELVEIDPMSPDLEGTLVHLGEVFSRAAVSD